MLSSEFIFDESCDDLFCKELDVDSRFVTCKCREDASVWRLVTEDLTDVSWDWI